MARERESREERQKWDARFGRPGLLFGLEPRPFLREAAAWLARPGRALDVACGEGQNAVFLAECGFAVTGVDISSVGLAKAHRRAVERLGAGRSVGAGEEPAQAPEQGAVRWVEADLRQWRPEPGAWAVVHCARYLQRDLVPHLVAALAPGGVLCLEMLTQLDPAEGPPARYRVAPNEVLGWAAELHVAYYREGAIDGVGLSHLVAVRR